ncbi:hypothetical protein PMAYCL1PPCAC_14062 [Pristionchus mayeri]|uniref:G protein-coupled receptor n=1 Tax=Pristionchus mayeri TaxID=1317129 RepID=A0AAN4ZM66_9BILA|nr:hypothetical protein PMAYCL1PPCAC_14062 [Pristionchus mayeri]
MLNLGYYPHEMNLVIFAEIMILSFAIFAYAYIRNFMICKSLNVFSRKYSVSHIFQVQENLRVLKFLLYFSILSSPLVIALFSFFLIFFYALRTWDLERYLCIELFNFCCAL